MRQLGHLCRIFGLAAALAAVFLASPADAGGPDTELLSLTPAPDSPLASIPLRHPGGAHPKAGPSAEQPPACDKDIDVSGSLFGMTFVAAQDNTICTNADIDIYENGGDVHVVQGGGEEAAFTITRIAADGTPTLVTQKTWAQTNTYTPDVKAFRQGSGRYIALALERLQVGNSACGVVIVEVTNAPDTPIVDQFIGSDWCDVHNVFVENDIGGDGRYVYLTADVTNDLRVLDIADLANIAEIGRYTHPDASIDNYVHDVTVVDHGGATGRRVYVSYWAAGLMILDAADVSPGIVESGSPNQPLNPDYSIDPPAFLTHHAYPNDDGTRIFIQDEFLSASGQEPVQMWDIGSPASPAYVDGIALGSPLMPDELPAHNLLVEENRLYVGWYKAGLQAFDFDAAGFIARPLYHQVQTETGDDPYDGAWGVRLANVGNNRFFFQSDRRYGLIVDAILDADGDGVPDLTDNCPAWPNPSQATPPWTVPPGDPDCDGFTDAEESFVGTDPADACADTAALDDEPDDRWPADFNDDQQANILDVVQLTPPTFNSAPPSPSYSIRKDLNADGAINILDVVRVTPPVFSHNCAS